MFMVIFLSFNENEKVNFEFCRIGKLNFSLLYLLGIRKQQKNPYPIICRKDIFTQWKNRNSEARPGLSAGLAAPIYSQTSHKMDKHPRA